MYPQLSCVLLILSPDHKSLLAILEVLDLLLDSIQLSLHGLHGEVDGLALPGDLSKLGHDTALFFFGTLEFLLKRLHADRECLVRFILERITSRLNGAKLLVELGLLTLHVFVSIV